MPPTPDLGPDFPDPVATPSKLPIRRKDATFGSAIKETLFPSTRPTSPKGGYEQTNKQKPAFVDGQGKQYPIVEQKIGKSNRTSPTIVKDGKTYIMEQDSLGRWVTAWEIKKSK